MSFTSSTTTAVLASRLSLTRRVDSSTNTTKSNRGWRKGCFAPPRSSSSVDEARSTKSRTAKGKKTSSSSSGGKKKTGSSSVQRIIHTDKIVSKLNAVLNKDEQKKSSNKDSIGNIDEELCPTKTKPWSEIKKIAKPSQTACGWDWTFYKLSNFSSEENAREYMAIKPVPAVKYRGYYYVVDHHHTLAALELAGWDVDVTLEEIYEFEDDLSEEAFWGIMEGKGWSFCRDESYKRIDLKDLPENFELSSFRNDVFRSLGGFARKFGVLKRGKSLEERLFFEFQWGYFFWLHRSDKYGLWPSAELSRGFDRLMTMIENTDQDEYIDKRRDVTDMIELSERVLQPLYSVLVQYIGPLAATYDQLPTGETKKVPGLKTLFGRDYLPGAVNETAVQGLIHINSLKNKKVVKKVLKEATEKSIDDV